MADGRYKYEIDFNDLSEAQDMIYFFFKKRCVRLDQPNTDINPYYEYISIDKVEIMRIYEIP